MGQSRGTQATQPLLSGPRTLPHQHWCPHATPPSQKIPPQVSRPPLLLVLLCPLT